MRELNELVTLSIALQVTVRSDARIEITADDEWAAGASGCDARVKLVEQHGARVSVTALCGICLGYREVVHTLCAQCRWYHHVQPHDMLGARTLNDCIACQHSVHERGDACRWAVSGSGRPLWTCEPAKVVSCEHALIHVSLTQRA